MSEETTDVDYRAETPVESITPGADASMTTEAMAGLEAANADPLADPAVVQQAHERAMFERYVSDQGNKIPDNFKDAGTWFDSLKGAQAKYTQTQQEISALKKQYEMSGSTNNPDYVPAVEPASEVAAPAETPAEPALTELRIPEPIEAATTPEAPVTSLTVTEQDYERWNVEIATTGELSNDSRTELRAKTGFSEAMVTDFMDAQQAKRQAAFNKAADVVGDGAKLSKILRWTANNFSGEQLKALQTGLAGPSSELTLRGLTSAYDAANANAEPTRKVNAVTSATAQPMQLPGYKSMAEYSMDKSNPRYSRDAKFRAAVDSRAVKTDWRML
jgi:hypothetical protein